MEIKIIKKSQYKLWDTFIDESNNGTIFHKMQFLSYHPSDRFTFSLLGFFKDGELVGCLPGGIKDNRYISPLGASYGSIVTKNVSFQDYETMIDTLIAYGRQKKLNEIVLTPAPITYMQQPHQIEAFMLSYKGFSVKYHLISNIIDLNNSLQVIINNFTNMHKRAIKKALKEGVTISLSNDVVSFYKMLIENKKKFKTNPTHSLSELKKIIKLFPQDIKLFIAKDKKHKPIAGILLFICNKKTTLAFYISHYYKYQELRAVNLLFYEIIKWSKENGFSFLDLGVSMNTFSDNPMEPSRSLIFFKEGIQTRGFLRTTYSYTL